MAVLATEKPIAAMLNVLQAQLGTTLSAIETERGDLTFVHPNADGWFDTYQEEMTAEKVQVEVYEGNNGEFPLDDFDLSTWLSGSNSKRITTQSEITVRIRHKNVHSTELSLDEMMKLTRRYKAAVIRIVRDDPTLSSNVDVCRPLRYSMRGEIDAGNAQEDPRTIGQVEVTFQVEWTETNANENTGSQTAPSYQSGLGISL